MIKSSSLDEDVPSTHCKRKPAQKDTIHDEEEDCKKKRKDTNCKDDEKNPMDLLEDEFLVNQIMPFLGHQVLHTIGMTCTKYQGLSRSDSLWRQFCQFRSQSKLLKRMLAESYVITNNVIEILQQREAHFRLVAVETSLPSQESMMKRYHDVLSLPWPIKNRHDRSNPYKCWRCSSSRSQVVCMWRDCRSGFCSSCDHVFYRVECKCCRIFICTSHLDVSGSDLLSRYAVPRPILCLDCK